MVKTTGSCSWQLLFTARTV